ncbi:DNA polymerase Y family protein [Miltoncostaea marina]|uniref:DNA polymerase Y family protein n=1 Tax=Miltoncostaea marina TaxID=2843215 RepID=UPI001C3C692F|nr:DNA polymerase Y family protein [Miltoncostaea marina]
MIVAVHIPRLPLLVALLNARRPLDAPVALGPPPGAPQVVGLCTPAAEAQGVRPGLRVGEALARCPGLDLVVADPDAAAEAFERTMARLEASGFAVEPFGLEGAALDARGTLRLHGGLDGVLRRVRAALPVGADGRVGAAPSLFAALQAAREAAPGRALVLEDDEVAAFLASLPVDRLPLEPRLVAALRDLGLRTIGQVAGLPRAAALDRLGFPGLTAWRLARGEAGRALRPRTPPRPLRASVAFPEPVGALPALEAAARLLLGELAGAAQGRGTALRTLTLRARLADGGSWARDLTLREATADAGRLAVAALPRLAEVTGPVAELWIGGDASGSLGGRQLTAVSSPAEERRARAGEAVRQVRAAQGDDALLRVVEIEPWTRLPERRWALAPLEP